jgi:RNA-binding protein YlmH
VNEQEKLLISKALDTIRISNLKSVPKFFGFLSPSEAAIITKNINLGNNVYFYGGYEQAERRMLGVLPEYAEEDFNLFPISVLEISFNKNFTLSHRDVLGALMSLGVSRQSVGDIIILSGTVYVFVSNEISDYFVSQIDKIKNVGVSVKLLEGINNLELERIQKTVDISFTVSTPRLDAVVSALTEKSRSVSEKLITDGLVFVNSFEVTKTTKRIQNGDIITVRKIGKFKITSVGNFSKKGREIISAQKYI